MSSEGVSPERRPLDVAALRHRTEPSRFALACVVSGLALAVVILVAVSLNGMLASLVYASGLALFVAVIWLALQLWRVRLLGAGLKVSNESLPEVQAAVDEVRDRLGYRQRVDVYVVAKATPSVSVTSAFGTRVIVVEGGAIADLTEKPGNSELVFLLSTCFGTLKARHDRWNVALVVFQGLGLLRILNPFLRPWYRATTFTGDQIAFATCADLDVSLSVVYRALVGKEIAPQVRPDGLLTQGLQVRRGVIMRLSQLLAEQPHPTNRYLNLLSFAASTSPSGAQYREGLGPDSQRKLDEAVRLFPVRQAHDSTALAGLVVAASLVLAAPFVGIALYEGSTTVDPAVADFTTPTSSQGVTDGPAQPDDSDSPSGDVNANAVWLSERVPDTIEASCAATDDYLDTVAEMACSGTSDDSVFIAYYSFLTPEAVAGAFQEHADSVITQAGDCSRGENSLTSWSPGDGVERGRLACYEGDDGSPVMAWTHDTDSVLMVAQGSSTVAELYSWWGSTQTYVEGEAGG
jgi:hypothetical protein